MSGDLNLTTHAITKVISKISENPNVEVFSTLLFIDIWEIVDKSSKQDFERSRGRNWRALVGKDLKKYSLNTGKIQQITPSNISPARWKIIK